MATWRFSPSILSIARAIWFCSTRRISTLSPSPLSAFRSVFRRACTELGFRTLDHFGYSRAWMLDASGMATLIHCLDDWCTFYVGLFTHQAAATSLEGRPR